MTNRAVEAFLLGRFRIRFAGQDLTGLDGVKAQELLSYLLLHRDRSHSREMLSGLLWGERPTEMARKHLRQTLWQVHSALQTQAAGLSNLLRVDSDYVSLISSDDLWLDVSILENAFTRVHGIAGKDLDLETVALLREVVDLYQGDLLEGWYQDWCLLARERLQVIYLTLLDKLMASCEARGAIEAGLVYGGRILDIDRARETTHRRLMRLHILAGDRTSALRQFARCRDSLRADLDVDPSRSTVALYQAIRDDQIGDDIALSSVFPRSAAPPPSPNDAFGQLHYLRSLLEDLQRHVQNDLAAVEIALTQQHASR